MKALRYGLAAAAKEHLAAGEPLTRLEAMVLYGVSNLPDVISETSGRKTFAASPAVT